MMTPYVQPKEIIDPSLRSQLWITPHARGAHTRARLKVGLLSSDFGVHPVATLIRSFVQLVDSSRVELFCFALTDKRSWWGLNISHTVEHFINLAATNTQVESRGTSFHREYCCALAVHVLHLSSEH